MLNAVSSRQSGQIIVEKFPESPQSGLIVERFIVKTTVEYATPVFVFPVNPSSEIKKHLLRRF